MPEAAFTFCAFSSVAALTRFFATRRKLMVRVFLPAHEVFKARIILRDPTFERAMRRMAKLQFAMAIVLTIGVAAWQYFEWQLALN
ncbi:MAG TPA: hypothetical protein VGN12_17195 [Pirellulales bacterium]|jgi:hypothetical protein